MWRTCYKGVDLPFPNRPGGIFNIMSRNLVRTGKWPMRSLRFFCLVALMTLIAASALAQVRIQGRDGEVEEAPTIGPGEFLLNYREEMRKFVQSISVFTRRYRPNFLVIPQNGLDLLVKIDDVEGTRVAPAPHLHAVHRRRAPGEASVRRSGIRHANARRDPAKAPRPDRNGQGQRPQGPGPRLREGREGGR